MKAPSPPFSRDQFATALAACTRTLAAEKELEIGFSSNHPSAPMSASKELLLSQPGATPDQRRLKQIRGEADMAALVRKHHKSRLHWQLRPQQNTAATAYDALELMRVELLGSAYMPGIAANLAQRMEHHCEQQGYRRQNTPDARAMGDILALLLRTQHHADPLPPSIAPLVAHYEEWAQQEGKALLTAMLDNLADQQAFAKAAFSTLRALDLLPPEQEQSGEQEEPSEEEATQASSQEQ